MKIQKFEEINIWKLAIKLTEKIYKLTKKKEFSKDFKLRDQIHGAIISVSSNIVEGFEKNNNNEFIRFLKIAKGSAGEVKNQLYIALTVKYISQVEFDNVALELDDLRNQIGGFITYLEKKRSENQFTRK